MSALEASVRASAQGSNSADEAVFVALGDLLRLGYADPALRAAAIDVLAGIPGVTTSTVTVPLVTALGVGLAERTPGRDPMIDGFGLIAFASLLPMIIVMSYGILASWLMSRKSAKEKTR